MPHSLFCLAAFLALVSPALAQTCGQGWSFRVGGSPGGYEICYDEARERTVLFSDTVTYEWDGLAWTVVATSGPPTRGAGAMVYDPVGQRCLLFGGYSSQGARKDLWSQLVHGGWPGSGSLLTDTLEWNPATNSWQRWATGPIGHRYAHRMAYDEARQQVILHGGYYFWNRNDTWRWNGATWTQVSSGGPARYVFGMTYDSHRERIVLHGGTTCCNEVEYGQTWIWNGDAWSLCPVEGPPRGYMNIAYDRDRQVMVLPGGMGPSPSGRTYMAETWELRMGDPCPADLDRDGTVAAEDLAAVLFAWGMVGGKAGAADIDRSGTVDASDLSAVLAGWGECP